MSTANPKILITGATGQEGRKTIDCLLSQEGIEIVADVRSEAKGAEFRELGIETVILDFDDPSTHLPAFEGDQ